MKTEQEVRDVLEEKEKTLVKFEQYPRTKHTLEIQIHILKWVLEEYKK